MPVGQSYSFVLGPLVSLVALAMIVLICRWVFSTSNRPASSVVRQRTESDFGLLVPVAVVRTRADAEMLRAVLRDAGIRAGVSDEDGGLSVMVFADDLERAQGLVGA